MMTDRELAQFFPYYQPIIDVLTGEIGGYEALARQQIPDGSIISAWPFFSDESIDTAQKLQVDRHVRAKALSLFAKRHGSAFLSVNISPALMNTDHQDAGGATLAMLDAYDIAPGSVVAEILESPGERETIYHISKRFHDEGLQVAIDDFGAGHSHMERLFDLKPDYLKIDMDLFRLAARGGVRADYLQALRYVTERNNIRVVCEGVETDDEFMFAMDCGARYIQGFLFSPAVAEMLPVDTFTEQIDKLRSRYLAQRAERLTRTTLHRVQVEAAILALKQNIIEDDVANVAIDSLREIGVFRFFACTANGEQVSSNYNLLDKLTIDRSYCGYNWSTRPYFTELTAMRRALDADDHIIHSSVYKDQERQQLCRTYGIGLSDSHLLLVDVAEEDLLAYIKDI